MKTGLMAETAISLPTVYKYDSRNYFDLIKLFIPVALLSFITKIKTVSLNNILLFINTRTRQLKLIIMSKSKFNQILCNKRTKWYFY